jgi:hypothetical protein
LQRLVALGGAIVEPPFEFRNCLLGSATAVVERNMRSVGCGFRRQMTASQGMGITGLSNRECRLSTLLSHSDRGQRGTVLQLWLNRLSSSTSLARQLDPNERIFSMLTHSSGTCHERTFVVADLAKPSLATEVHCRFCRARTTTA